MPVKRDKKLEKMIAKERISFLIKRAIDYKKMDYHLARRYVELAIKMAERYRVKMKKYEKRSFCKNCLYPYRSDRMRVRIKKGRVIITCLNCGKMRRFKIKSQERRA